MHEGGENFKKPNRREVLSAALAAAIANALGSNDAAASAPKQNKNIPDHIKLLREDLARAEEAAVARTKAYEEMLRQSPLFKTGSPSELIALFRRGLMGEKSEKFEAGPNDSPLARNEGPRLYPGFDERELPVSRRKYPGLELRFGENTTNAVRISADEILRPDSLRPSIFGGKGSGLTVEKIQLRRDDANVGSVQLNDHMSEGSIDCQYAIALHTSFKGDEGPWGWARNGRIDLSGYLVSMANRPQLEKLVSASIEAYVPMESREAFRKKMNDSVLMIGNVFEWRYLYDRISNKETGVGQPVFVRRKDGLFAFCGVVQDLLPLNLSNTNAPRGAVAYIVAKPEKVRKIVGNTL